MKLTILSSYHFIEKNRRLHKKGYCGRLISTLNFSDVRNCTKKVYNLKSKRTPPNYKLLDPFEADLFKLIEKIKFRKDHNSFQTKINHKYKGI